MNGGNFLKIKVLGMPNNEISIGKKISKIIIVIGITFLVFVLSGVLVLLFLVNSYTSDLPELDINTFKNVSQTSYIYDANGNIIADYKDTEDRTWISIEDMPQDLIKAVVSIEDRRFYSHKGYDVKRIIGAVLSVVTHKDVYGGSTITQQLIKNTLLTNEVTLKRKVQEIMLSSELEKMMSKDEILEAYLNVIYLGGSNYGVAAAAKDYLGKDDLSTLTTKECAFLAGLTQNPYYYDPRANYYQRNAFDRNEDRISDVLYAMQVCGHITEDEYYKIMDEKIEIKEKSSSSNMYKYPHFIEYAISDVIDGFIEYRGLENTKENRNAIENEIRTKGYKIYTTINPYIQKSVQETLSEFHYPSFKADPSKGDVDDSAQAASVVIDQHTGEIVAMVGSVEEPTIKKSFNRAISSNMPVGSIIKPLSAYAPAIEAGLSPESPVINIPSAINGYDSSGKNTYPGGGLSTIGIVTARYSLEKSFNITTARLICNTLGFDKSAEYLASMGIDYNSISKTGSGLALGSSGIDMLEITGAYATIANNGIYKEPRAYTQVVDANGKVILNAESVKDSHQVFSKGTAYLITDMMKDVITYGTGKAAKLDNITAAGKTGTNEDNSITFAGFTGYYTSAVWVGNDYFLSFEDGTASSNTITAPLWKKYMDKIHTGLEDKPVLDITAEDCDLEKAIICNVSGKLATDYCTHGTSEGYFLSGMAPTEPCDMHITVKTCAQSENIASETCALSNDTPLKQLYVPDNSDLFTIDRQQVEEIFGPVIWGEDELNKYLSENICQWNHNESYIDSDNDINSEESNTDEEIIEDIYYDDDELAQIETAGAELN